VIKRQFVHIGTFGQPLGLKGQVKIIMHISNFNLFKSLSPYIADDKKTFWNFIHLNIIKGKLIAQLVNCNNRNCAEELKGKKIFVYKSHLPKIGKNQFYITDLINCEVKTSNDKLLGSITDVNNFGAGDLINIKQTNNKSFYIPMNKENVVKVDIKKIIFVVNPIKGILN